MEPEHSPSPVAQGRSRVVRAVAVAISTGLGVGFLPGAPGTYGSALAILIFVLFSPVSGGLLLLSVAALTAVGVWASDVSESVFERGDDGRIVIDEIVGQLLALSPLLFMAPNLGASAETAVLVTGFVAFRGLDIGKPGPVGWAERHFKGGLGVMMDDLIAGVLAAVIVAASLLVLPGIFAEGLS